MTQSLTFQLARIPTPVGVLLIATDEQGRLRAVEWETHLERMRRLLGRQYGRGVVRLVEGADGGAVADKLTAYFAGDLRAIDDIPTHTAGTPFQREVWAALRAIPAGETWTYSRLAAHIGRPKAVRAVGLANGANPVNIVTPCHRVIGADGSLTGYGGGLDRKTWLLGHEGARFKAARANT
jgi:methylated-DNA-[protein]-cysteine S-methyltransferase